MKEQLSRVDLAKLVQHDFADLGDSRIDKVYQDGSFFFLQIYTGKVRTNLVMDVPAVAYLTDYKPVFPAPKGFCMFLRKHIMKGRIQSVEQLNADRLLKFTITRKIGETIRTYHMYVEFFGKGNLVVCDENDKILSLLNTLATGDRILRGGQPYVAPPAPLDPAAISGEDFAALFDRQPASTVLATKLGVGGEYGQLLCTRASIDPKAEQPDAKALYEQLKTLLEEYAPQFTDKAAYPVSFDEQATSVETFSQAIAQLWDSKREQDKSTQQAKVERKELTKAEKVLKKQEEQVKKMEEKAAFSQRAGELLYEQFQEVSTLLEQAAADRKALDKKAFKKKYTDHPLVSNPDPEQFVLSLE